MRETKSSSLLIKYCLLRAREEGERIYMANTNKIIYTRRIAMKLIEMGHIAAGTMPNPSKPEFLCWIFTVTPKFERDLQTILDERKAQRGARATAGVIDEAVM
jgi:hypothetical protein